MSVRLRVNPITCEAHGMCAELFPESIVEGEPVPLELVEHARRAADACPTLALLLERPPTERDGTR